MSSEDFFELLLYIQLGITLIGVGLGTFYFRHLKGLVRALFFYLILCAIGDLCGRLLAEYQGNNLILVSVFGILELSLFVWCYDRYLISKNKLLFRGFSAVAVLLLIADGLTTNYKDPMLFHSYGRVLGSFCVVVFSIWFASESLQRKGTSTYPLQLLNSALLIYFTLASLFWLFVNFLVNVGEDYSFLVWLFMVLATVLLYSLITAIVWQTGRTHKH